MAKRKIDCSLDEIVGEYLMKRKCEKSRKLFEEKIGCHTNDGTKILENLLNYLKSIYGTTLKLSLSQLMSGKNILD